MDEHRTGRLLLYLRFTRSFLSCLQAVHIPATPHSVLWLFVGWTRRLVFEDVHALEGIDMAD